MPGSGSIARQSAAISSSRPLPISAEAKGQLRLLYARIGADAERVEAAARRVPKKLRDDIRRKFSRGAERALAEIVRTIPAPLIWTDPTPAQQLADDTAGTPATDPNVKRYRPLIIPMEQGDFGLAVTQKRVQWEVNRRLGRAYQVEVTCDSWRDEAGSLWTVNTWRRCSCRRRSARPASST